MNGKGDKNRSNQKKYAEGWVKVFGPKSGKQFKERGGLGWLGHQAHNLEDGDSNSPPAP